MSGAFLGRKWKDRATEGGTQLYAGSRSPGGFTEPLWGEVVCTWNQVDPVGALAQPVPAAWPPAKITFSSLSF